MTVSPFTISLRFESGSAERLAELLKGVVSDLALVLLRDPATDLFERSDEAVRGTDASVIVLRLATAKLNAEVRAALRAAGYELPDRDDVASHPDALHGVDGSTLAASAPSANEATPQVEPLFRRLARTGFSASNGEARRVVRAGKVTINGFFTTDEDFLVTATDTVRVGRRVVPT